MIKKLTFYSILVILALVLAACQTAQASTSVASVGLVAGSSPSNFNPAQSASATPTATAIVRPTTTPTATALPVTAAAENSAKAYFAALEKKDFSAAAQWVSIFSLSFAGMTRSDATSQLSKQSTAGTAWSGLQIVDSQVFNDTTILVHVTYLVGSATPSAGTATPQSAASPTPAAVQASQQQDELWSFRLEGGQWLYNWNNLIDYKTVDVAAQTTEHITIKPTQLVRYSDRIELHFMMQNQTSDVVYFVQPYDSLAVFHFGDQTVEADKTRKVVISGLRTSYDEAIMVKGLYTSYPNWVEIRKWKGYVVNPWYSFQF